MRRREFVTLLGGTVAAWPLAAGAQKPEQTRRIIVLVGLDEKDAEAQRRAKAFRLGGVWLWPAVKRIGTLAGLDLGELRDDLQAFGVGEHLDCGTLGLQPKTGAALLLCADAIVSDQILPHTAILEIAVGRAFSEAPKHVTP